MILEYLTEEKKKDALYNFYKRILLPVYEEDIDYKEVSFDNELVKFFQQNLENENLKLIKVNKLENII